MIYYKSGKNKRIISSYSFVKEFKTTVTTTVNFTANQTANKGANQTANDTVDKGVNDTGDSTDYNKLKQKPNRNILSKVSHGDFDFISNEFLETFTLWLEYKKDRRENYKSEKSLKACYNKLVKLSKGNPAVASQIVDESIANNWAGFFELKNNKINAYNIRLTLLLIYRKFPFIHLLHGKFELYRCYRMISFIIFIYKPLIISTVTPI